MYACVGALVLVGAVVGVRKPEKKVDSHSDSEPEEAETSASWHAGSEQPELMFFPRKTRYVRVKGAV